MSRVLISPGSPQTHHSQIFIYPKPSECCASSTGKSLLVRVPERSLVSASNSFLEVIMRSSLRLLVLVVLCSALAFAQVKPGVLSADEVKHLAPSSYFFSGQTAPVQLRNSTGFRAAGNKVVVV